jgi:L-arabinose isomerase
LAIARNTRQLLLRVTFAEMAGMEFLMIGHDLTVAGFKKELRWSDLY